MKRWSESWAMITLSTIHRINVVKQSLRGYESFLPYPLLPDSRMSSRRRYMPLTSSAKSTGVDSGLSLFFKRFPSPSAWSLIHNFIWKGCLNTLDMRCILSTDSLLNVSIGRRNTRIYISSNKYIRTLETDQLEKHGHIPLPPVLHGPVV